MRNLRPRFVGGLAAGALALVWALAGGLGIDGSAGSPAARALAQNVGDVLNLQGIAAGDKADPLKKEPVLKARAEIVGPRGSLPPQLRITAEIAPGWHIYSVTQKKGGPLRTRIRVEEVRGVRLAGKFTASPKPKVGFEPDVWPDLPIETHEGRVTWTVPLKVEQGVDLKTVRLKGTIEAQACDANGCLPPERFPFVAQYSNPPDNAAIGTYQAPNTHAVIRGHIEPKRVAPGETLRVVLAAEPSPGYHVYALADRDTNGISKPTLIVVDVPEGWTVSRARPNRPPHEEPSDVEPSGVVRYHEGPVEWTVDVKIPADVEPADYVLSGIIGYQTCYEGGCDRMTAARFEAVVAVAATNESGTLPLVFTPADYREAVQLAAERPTLPAEPEKRPVRFGELLLTLGAALLGGFILNFMPCVLPVIGLKVLAFVEQSGDDRRRVLMLNLWYVAGLLSVFLVLATLAVQLQMKWGEQFTSQTFNIVLICLVFAMALSFLGVWEIPIPGFVGSGKANELASKEGAIGAFAKGVLTTVLATPCSGPFLGPVFGFTLTLDPWLVYAVFGCVGLGMASPYLLIGVFPSLIRFLPRPGAWMDTFKQLMGFVLLATVAFLFTFIPPEYFVRTFTVLVAIWAGCWWIGRRPITQTRTRRLLGWLEAVAIPTVVAVLAFGNVLPDHELPWRPYSPTELERLIAEGHTVMLDFTANWCLTCQTNEQIALNTPEVKKLVEQYDIVPMVADWTDGSPEIKKKLTELGSNSIPLFVVFPAGQPDRPIVLRDLITEDQVLEALRKAGPSRTAKRQRQEQTAMR